MRASIEKPDGTYIRKAMGNPICGKDFCDGCGDCLSCDFHGKEEWCGGSSWVIYKDDPKNP